MLDRGDYWQCAFVIPKGGTEEVRQRGLEAFRADIVELAPLLKDRVTELQSWDDIKLLSVKVDRLREWYRPGLLCIGDAAHAMSPIGGVGINLAIQDAVAAANRLAGPLRTGQVGIEVLADVQRRRTFPTRATQRMQLFAQNNFLRQCAFVPRAADATMADASDQSLSAAAAHSGAGRRDGIPSRAHCHAGRGRRGSA